MIIISVTCRASVIPVSLAGFMFHDAFTPHRLRKLNITCTDIEPQALMAMVNDPEVLDVTITKPAATRKFFDDEREHYAAVGRQLDRSREESDREIGRLLGRAL